MAISNSFGIIQLLQRFPQKIALTWLLVIVENALLALIPLFIGLAIDGLLANESIQLLNLAVIFFVLIIVSVVRRIYDTRAYGSIRIILGIAVDDQHNNQQVSIRTARLDMARELVDFLENDIPLLFTAVIQICVSIIILAIIETPLAYTALALLAVMILLYTRCHQRFFKLNIALNNQTEQQVRILHQNKPHSLAQHLKNLRRHEVHLSDTEAILYGLIFIFICVFILSNLILSANIIGITAGMLFSIISYSWEFAEASIELPMAMQKMTRLKEISQRLNSYP